MTNIAKTTPPADDRLDQLQRWTIQAVHQTFAPNDPIADDYRLTVWQPVSGDASFRRYFRTEFNGHACIVMDAPPEKEAVAPFIDIAGRLIAAGVHAPVILAQQLEDGFLLLEDLGDVMLKSMLQPANGQQLFDRVLPVLARMASACDTAHLPLYSQGKLEQELDLFSDWFLQRHLNITMNSSEREQWQALKTLLTDSALAQPQVFVHRDFHSCNLHALPDGGTGVIDFQDAVCGPLTYDLASWLWDRYITWPRAELLQWMEQARLQLAPQIDTLAWQQYCDFMGLQRNLKIIGIFARLHYRDGKAGYVDLLPRFSTYVTDVMARHAMLEQYRPLLAQWLDAERCN